MGRLPSQPHRTAARHSFEHRLRRAPHQPINRARSTRQWRTGTPPANDPQWLPRKTRRDGRCAQRTHGRHPWRALAQTTGGMYVWLRLPEHIDTSEQGELWPLATQHGVLYVPGHHCYPSEGQAVERNTMRLSFGVQSPESIRTVSADSPKPSENSSQLVYSHPMISPGIWNKVPIGSPTAGHSIRSRVPRCLSASAIGKISARRIVPGYNELRNRRNHFGG